MTTKKLFLVALVAGATAANAQEEQKAKKSLGFDVTNVSLGIGPSLTGGVDPKNFTHEEFANHQGTMIDVGMSANVYGKWNLRMHLGYIAGALDPVDYFDQVGPFEELDEVYDAVNGYEWANRVNGIVPQSFVLLNLGVSRTFNVSNVKITPHISAWFTNERGGIIVDGYEVIATGEYVDETILAYQDWGTSVYPQFGLDLELDKYLYGMSLNVAEFPMPILNFRIGYQF